MLLFHSTHLLVMNAHNFVVNSTARCSGFRSITTGSYFPANATHRSNVGPMLDQRRRRWANIGPILDRCVVFAGLEHQGKCLTWSSPRPEQILVHPGDADILKWFSSCTNTTKMKIDPMHAVSILILIQYWAGFFCVKSGVVRFAKPKEGVID